MRTLNEVRDDLAKVSDISCKPAFTRPKNGEVIDEDMSVKWNREEVTRLQSIYDEEVKKLNTNKNKYRDKLHKELYKIIQKEVKDISIKDAKSIYDYAWHLGGAVGYNAVFIYLQDDINLVCNILHHKNK